MPDGKYPLTPKSLNAAFFGRDNWCKFHRTSPSPTLQPSSSSCTLARLVFCQIFEHLHILPGERCAGAIAGFPENRREVEDQGTGWGNSGLRKRVESDQFSFFAQLVTRMVSLFETFISGLKMAVEDEGSRDFCSSDVQQCRNINL